MADRLIPLWYRQLLEAVPALRWHPSGGRLAVGSLAGEVATFSSEGEPGAAENVEQEVLSVGWSGDGAWLAVSGRNGGLHLWEEGLARGRFSLGRWAHALAWDPSRAILAVAAGPDVYVVDTDGSVRAEYLLHPGYVNDLAWEASGELMAASVGGISFYDTAVAGKGPVSFAPSTGTVLRLAQSPDGALLAGGKSNGAVVVWRLEGGAGTTLTGSEGAVQHLSWSPDGNSLAVAAIDELTIWRREPEGIAAEGLAHCSVGAGEPGGVQFHPWRDLLAWGGAGGAVSIWNPQQAEDGPRFEYRLAGDVTQLAWDPMGERLAVATSSGLVACLGLD